MEYTYINNTFTPCGDIKIPDGKYILMSADSFSFLLLGEDRFKTVINRFAYEKEDSPNIAGLLRLILTRAVEVACESGKIYYDGAFFGISHEGIFSVEGSCGFFVIKSSEALDTKHTPSTLQSIIEKALKEETR